MRVIGLTGGIACGKSTVSNWLQTQPDCRVIDGDIVSRELSAPGGPALPLMRDQFGDAVFFSDGSLNRRALGRLVFSNSSALKKLDDLMAPLLEQATLAHIQKAREDGILLCFLDYPLLFEKGYNLLCDTVWCVTLPRSLQLQRLMDRDRISEKEALQRMNAVLSTEEKASRSQVLIDNSGELSFTLSLLPSLLETERAQASAPRRRRSAHFSEGSESVSNDLKMDTKKSVPDPVPDSVMKRPVSIQKKAQHRKAAWKLPSWLMIFLFSCSFLLLACITAQALMQAYLTHQAEKHLAEEQAIHANYPLIFQDLIDKNASDFNLNPAFVAAVIRNESSFQPMAESSVGARGLMQLMPETAEWIAGKIKLSGYAFDRMYDPETNIRFGCWYLQYLGNLFHGDPVCVACAYHAGQGQVTAWLSDPKLSSDGVSLSLSQMAEGPTKTYAGRVIRTYGIYKALYYDKDSYTDHDDYVSSMVPGQSR